MVAILKDIRMHICAILGPDGRSKPKEAEEMSLALIGVRPILAEMDAPTPQAVSKINKFSQSKDDCI